jgi:hypothetical protein
MNCPACGHKLDEQGACHNAGMTYVCYYRKDPNGDHFLVVSDEIDPETDKLALEVEHPKACPLVEFDGFDGGYKDYTCAALEAITEGYADGAEELEKPGRYLIEPWGCKTWTDYGWEGDGGVYLTPVVEPLEETT